MKIVLGTDEAESMYLTQDDLTICYGLGGYDHIYGSSGFDMIFTGYNNAYYDYLFGTNTAQYAQNDGGYANGGAGNDWLIGDNGDDFLYDTIGDNTFFTGAGNDTITTTAVGIKYGKEVYNDNTILDFEIGTDKIVFNQPVGNVMLSTKDDFIKVLHAIDTQDFSQSNSKYLGNAYHIDGNDLIFEYVNGSEVMCQTIFNDVVDDIWV